MYQSTQHLDPRPYRRRRCSKPKPCRNHRTTVAARMTEPARLMKDQPRSQVARKTLPQAGIWYAGSSMTKGAGSPAKILVFFRMMPETDDGDAMPMKYSRETATTEEPPNIRQPAMMADNGHLSAAGDGGRWS